MAANKSLADDEHTQHMLKETPLVAKTSTGKDAFSCQIFSYGAQQSVNKEPPPPAVLIRSTKNNFIVHDDQGKPLDDPGREKCYEGLQAAYDLYRQ